MYGKDAILARVEDIFFFHIPSEANQEVDKLEKDGAKWRFVVEYVTVLFWPMFNK